MSEDLEQERKPIEAWAEVKTPAPWLLAAAKGMRAWVVGQEVTEEEFDAALSDAAGIRIGVSNAR